MTMFVMYFFACSLTFDGMKWLGFRSASVSTEEKVEARTKHPQTTEPQLFYIVCCSTLMSKSIMLIKSLLVFLILCIETLSSPKSNFFFYLESRLLYSDCQDILPYQLWSSPSAPCEI